MRNDPSDAGRVYVATLATAAVCAVDLPVPTIPMRVDDTVGKVVVAVPLHTTVTSAPEIDVFTVVLRVFPSEIVRVALVVGAVIVTLFMLVAVATPSTGVTSVGLVARTGAPLHCAVVHTGSADAPPHTSISVVAPTARDCCAPVAVVPTATSA